MGKIIHTRRENGRITSCDEFTERDKFTNFCEFRLLMLRMIEISGDTEIVFIREDENNCTESTYEFL